MCIAEVDQQPAHRRQLYGGNQAATERMLHFGRELKGMSIQLKREYGSNDANRKLLHVSHQEFNHTGQAIT